MIDFTNTIEIDRGIHDVYLYLRDLENTPHWNWAIVETRKISPGPIGIGTRYQQTRSVPSDATEELEITNLRDDELIEIEGDLAQFPAHLTYHLERAGGGTKVSNHVELEARGGLRLLAPVLAARIERSVAANLRDLKAKLETG